MMDRTLGDLAEAKRREVKASLKLDSAEDPDLPARERCTLVSFHTGKCGDFLQHCAIIGELFESVPNVDKGLRQELKTWCEETLGKGAPKRPRLFQRVSTRQNKEMEAVDPMERWPANRDLWASELIQRDPTDRDFYCRAALETLWRILGSDAHATLHCDRRRSRTTRLWFDFKDLLLLSSKAGVWPVPEPWRQGSLVPYHVQAKRVDLRQFSVANGVMSIRELTRYNEMRRRMLG
jgi:hypothetical protein